MMSHRSLCFASLALIFPLLAACASPGSSKAKQTVFAPGASLSEDESVADALGSALAEFLRSLKEDGDFMEDPERQRHGFFYGSLRRIAPQATPVVLKSYPVGSGAYMVTVAFYTGTPDRLALSRVAEFEALPAGDSYRFQCAYGRNTARLAQQTVGDVTFRFEGEFDQERAANFVETKGRLEALRGRKPVPLQYDCFGGLQGLLRAFGLVHDASKCNFLERDLGFLWNGGQRYSTGTGDESYLFGYVRGMLAETASDPGAIYSPYLNGVAAYYGGYGLSGDTMEDLASQFRGEWKRRPDIDFLEEFKKGRKSSVHRHFSHYVMCAFLFQAIVERHGEAVGLQPLQAGADGERFFTQLESLLGVTEADFHDTILGLIKV
ncbi:MAG: hypothetical protein P1V35_10350 [Planctomycetota bacterium]|nr:hypothetical protein [Planctomycetota bacterium]